MDLKNGMNTLYVQVEEYTKHILTIQMKWIYWRKDPNNQGYIPRKNTKKGKKLYDELQNLPVVTSTELNLCIGWEKGIVHIGFKEGKEYFGFSTNSKYEIIIPKDCREITETEYNNI